MVLLLFNSNVYLISYLQVHYGNGSDAVNFSINADNGTITTMKQFDKEGLEQSTGKISLFFRIIAKDDANSEDPNHNIPNTPNSGM